MSQAPVCLADAQGRASAEVDLFRPIFTTKRNVHMEPFIYINTAIQL